MQLKKSLRLLSATAAILLAGAAYGQTIAYDNGVQAGNQNYPASLGDDFTVNKPIVVTSLGAFASGGAAGFAGTITVGIYNTTTMSLVAGPVSFSGSSAASAGTYINGDWFKPLTPGVILPAGNYSIVAVGFSTDKDGNSTIAGYTAPTQNSGGGLITFSTQGRYDANTADTTLTFPTTTGTFQFLAGTFQFQASIPSDAGYQTRYAANLNIGESYIDITNTAANGNNASGPGFGTLTGNICVNVYAFDPNEELISCCSCLVTPDQTVNLGVNANLVSKTLTGVVPTSVTVKLIATAPTGTSATSGGNCTNSAAGTGTPATLAVINGMAAWGTTLHGTPTAGSDATTETAFTPATPSASELASIAGRCSNIIGNASGFGICSTCRTGALGGTKAP